MVPLSEKEKEKDDSEVLVAGHGIESRGVCEEGAGEVECWREEEEEEEERVGREIYKEQKRDQQKWKDHSQGGSGREVLAHSERKLRDMIAAVDPSEGNPQTSANPSSHSITTYEQ